MNTLLIVLASVVINTLVTFFMIRTFAIPPWIPNREVFQTIKYRCLSLLDIKSWLRRRHMRQKHQADTAKWKSANAAAAAEEK